MNNSRTLFFISLFLVCPFSYSMGWLPILWEYEPTIDPATQLWNAARDGNTVQVGELLKSGVNPAVIPPNKTTTPFMAAIESHYLGVQQLFLEHKLFEQIRVRETNVGYTHLHFAAAHQAVHLLEPLIWAGNSVNDQENILGKTPLHRATIGGYDHNRLVTIAALLINKADPMLKNSQGENALQYTQRCASAAMREEIVDLIAKFYPKF